MSVKKVTETTASKILNSDIYDLTRFVDDIKKKNIDGIDASKETLMVGMYGYMGSQFASLLQNSIVTASELSNEAIPTRAKFDRNVITHALSLGVRVAATAANMKILLMFPEKALRANMIDGKFVFKATTPLYFDEYEFHTDYDIEITYTDLTDSTNGKNINYVYTAKYLMDDKNEISDIENPFLPPIAVFNYVQDNMIVLTTNIHQVYYQEIHEKILSSDVIANKTISFSFEDQLSHFIINVKEPSDSQGSDGNTVVLNAVYDGLYNQEIASKKYCYYQYINSNTIRIRFDPTNYQPPANSDITIQLYTTAGAAGNFEYSEEKTISLTSNEYTNLYCIIAQRGDDGSCGGLDRQTIDQLQHVIPKEALSRGSVTTGTDLTNFFNSLNNENSVLHVFRKEDNILDRVYYVYNLMKDSERNIVPTNTIPIYLESTRRDNHNGNIYLESGTPLFFYKFGDGADMQMIRDNYIGYLEQRVNQDVESYAFYNSDGMTTFQGTPTDDTLAEWAQSYSESFDPDKEMIDFKYDVPKPPMSYDFFSNASICFKIYSNDYIANKMNPNPNDPDHPENKELYNKYYYGTCRECKLKQNYFILNQIIGFMRTSMMNDDIVDYEIEFTDGSVITHYPMRNSDTVDPVDSGYMVVDEDNLPSHVGYTSTNLISNIRYFRPYYTEEGSVSDRCIFPLPLIKRERTPDSGIFDVDGVIFYTWLVWISFYDESEKFSSGYSANFAKRPFLVSDYIYNLSTLDQENRRNFTNRYFNNIINPYVIGTGDALVLESVDTINVYSYDGQDVDGHGEYSFDSLKLAEGDLIRYELYDDYGSSQETDFVYTDPNTWPLGEVLSIEKVNNRIISIEVLSKNEKLGEFGTHRYKLPTLNDQLDENCIVTLSKISKFLYTTPLSIILSDKDTMGTHRITASYYLDIINETRYLEFEHINSKSPIQYIVSSIKTYRSSYLSDNRYKYTIRISLTPNTGSIDNEMINRTQIIGVFYKKSSKDATSAKPAMYSIAQFVDTSNGTLNFEIDLYSRPFAVSGKNDSDDDRNIIDKQNDVYIGPKQLIQEIRDANNYNGEDTEAIIQEFFDKYKLFDANPNIARPLTVDDLPEGFNLDALGQETDYVNHEYMNLNTELKLYILYRYDTISTSVYSDGASKEYMSVNTANTDALFNTVSQATKFQEIIPVGTLTPENYTLKSMVLTNVYNVYQGINLLYDYSDIMNSFITSIKTNDIFNPDQSGDDIESYIINRVPCVRYFYWNTEERVLTFLKDMKAKINYVMDAIAPLEATFGLDYKFFNTYGPSNMYRLTDDDGDVTDLIDNVALTMTFRAKFYNEDSDAASMIDPIKNTIKEYLEKLDQLDDIHFPNITTLVESEYSEYLIYFEFVSFNVYDATNQHIITVENLEMLSMVPEFLHVDTNDWNGKPYINIRIVTG